MPDAACPTGRWLSLSDRRVVGPRRYGTPTQDHERVVQGCHHGKGKTVELKAECNVVRMHSLTHPLRKLGSGARLDSSARTSSTISNGTICVNSPR